MSRQKNKLTALAVKNAEPGKYSDGGGLILHKTTDGGKWIYRYSFSGRRREMGLGSLADTPLSAARKARDNWYSVLLDDLDPISERERRREEKRLALDRQDPTFEEVANMVFEAKKAGLRGEGERGRWFSPIALHMIPKIGKKRISKIHQTDIRDALAPIWKTKHSTAEKAISRTHIIFRQARLMGHDVDPFTVDAAKHMLGEVSHKVVSITATPWQEIPDLFGRLDRPSATHRALRWMILTAVRSEGARGARFSEIEDGIWTVPAERMKGAEGKAQDFRVPLSPAAIEIVEWCAESASTDFLFPSYRKGYISSTAVAKGLNEIGEAGRPHGFRTSFRTWVQDTEAATFDVAETALAHIVGGKVERTYARSDLLEPRRRLMDAWSRFVTGAGSEVVYLDTFSSKK